MRPLLVRRRALAAVMALGLARLAIISVGTHEHPSALVVDDDLVEIGIASPTQRAGRVEPVARERVILEIERYDTGMRRDSIDALLAAGAEQLQRWAIVHLRIVEFRRRRRVHHITCVDLAWIGIGGCDGTE